MRFLVFAVSLAFIIGFAILTALDIADYGLTGVGVVALVILILFGFGVIGAMLQPPRR